MPKVPAGAASLIPIASSFATGMPCTSPGDPVSVPAPPLMGGGPLQAGEGEGDEAVDRFTVGKVGAVLVASVVSLLTVTGLGLNW